MGNFDKLFNNCRGYIFALFQKDNLVSIQPIKNKSPVKRGFYFLHTHREKTHSGFTPLITLYSAGIIAKSSPVQTKQELKHSTFVIVPGSATKSAWHHTSGRHHTW